MKVVGIDNMREGDIRAAVHAGGRFVVYQYCISVLVVSFKRASNIYFITPGESAFTKGLPFSLISLILGWWGIPWGPIWSIATIYTNCSGGKNVTDAVVRSLSAPPPVARV